MSFMVYHQKMTWQKSSEKFPTSPSPYHRRLLTSLLQSFAAHRLQRRQRAAAPGRRQKHRAHLARGARWQRCLVERGEVKPWWNPTFHRKILWKVGKYMGNTMINIYFMKINMIKARKIWTFEKCLPCWSGFGCEELKKSWLSWTQKPDMFNGVTKMVEIKWGVFWPKLDGLTNTKRMLMIVLPSGNLT